MKLIFCLKINVKCFLKLLSNTIILGVCGRACLNYPKHQVCIILQYLKKEVSNEVGFFAFRQA